MASNKPQPKHQHPERKLASSRHGISSWPNVINGVLSAETNGVSALAINTMKAINVK